jgi:ABC-type spermidine/putrescine transport system permease subunit I
MAAARFREGRVVKRLGAWLPAAPAALLLLLFLAGPLVLLLRVSFFAEAGGAGFYRPGSWSADSYRALLGDGYFRSVWSFTVLLGAGVAALALLLAYPLALFIRSLPPRAKALALAAVVLPKLASVLVVVYGLKVLLGSSGPVNGLLLALGAAHEPVALYPNLLGVVVGEVYLLLPYPVLVLAAGLERIDPELTAAARGLGATPWQAFRRVTLPLSLPALAVAAQLSLVWALGALLGPLLLGGPEETTLALEVQRLTLEKLNWPRGAAAAVVMLLTLAACLAFLAWPLRRTGGESRP